MGDDQVTPSIGERMAEAWLTELQLSARFDRPWVEAAVDWVLGEQPVAAAGTVGGEQPVAAAGTVGGEQPAGTTGEQLPRAIGGDRATGVTRSDQPADAAGVVIDVGCGAGGAACAFAARLPSGAQVVGVDRDPRLLAMARRRAVDEGVDDRITWTTADVGRLPVQPGSVDVVWASGVVHHVPDQQEAVRTLAGLLRPGGRVVLVEGGLPLRCLPHEIGLGRPGLEARLDEARSRWFVDMRAELHGPAMPYGWPEALARAGLVDVKSRSFVAERTPPLDEVGRAVVERHLRSAHDELGERLAPDDRDTLARLLDPDDPAYVGRRDDLMVCALRTVHTGRSPT